MHPKKIITIGVLAVTVFFVYYSVNASPLIDDGEYTYISNIKWYNNYDEGLNAAQEQNKPMLVYFWAIWCQYCRGYHEEVYPDPEVKPILEEEFVLVAIDLDTNREDAQKFNAQYPPKLVFLDPGGGKITDLPGYVPKETFLPIIQQISTLFTTDVEIPEHLPRTETGGEEEE